MDTTRPIRFFHRGRLVALDGVEPTRSVLEWLREDARCTGTKEGCAEGDCGACTVIVGTPHGDGLRLRTMNACTLFLPALDGRALFTVEDLGGTHPAQQTMVECHGSQCGYCTPGFVMTLAACAESHAASPGREALADALSGNLCRCTGYRPILDAAERLFALPPQPLDTAAAARALREADDGTALDLRHDGQRWSAPRTLAALAREVAERPRATLVAGATDVALAVTKQLRRLDDVIHVGGVAELARIDSAADGTLHLGAAVPLEDAWAALAARWPALRTMWRRFAAPAVRHAGTLGGNVANGSPIGDGAPVLLALDASLVLRQGDTERTLPLHDFQLGYRRNALQPGEFVQAIVVPPFDGVLRAYKASKRFDCDISGIAAALALRLDDAGVVRDARLAYGGMAATVCRARRAEQALEGRPWDEAALRDACAALADDYAPIDDLRASAAYRRAVAANLLRRFWLETRAAQPLPPAALDVWAAA